MREYEGRVAEISLDPSGSVQAWIQCPAEAVPAAGRYLLAHAPADMDAPLPVPLFASSQLPDGFIAAPPVPSTWGPGVPILLRGPLGHGFDVPAGVQRLALVAAGTTAARLLPLAQSALDANAAVAVFTRAPVSAQLPASIEVFPFEGLPDPLAWADFMGWPDFMALDVPIDALGALPAWFGASGPACPAQVLVETWMPCAGVGECGACAVSTRRGWKLACKDGPVFNVKDLEWRHR